MKPPGRTVLVTASAQPGTEGDLIMINPPRMADLASRSHGMSCPRTALWRGPVAVAILMIAVLGAAACGNGSSKSSASSTSATSFMRQAVKFAQCMRAHGVTNFPDPPASGGAFPINRAGIDQNSSTYQTAAQACQRYAPAGETDPNQQAQAQTQQLKFARCMRKHGITNFPEGNNGRGQQSINQYGIDPNSPAFKAANKACSHLLDAGNGAG